jgi:coenzyme F420-reducing hydrogenase delta subunit
MRLSYPLNVKIVRVPCSGRVNTVHLLRTLEEGADGVYVAGCLEGDCHFMEGNLRAKRRVAHARELIGQSGLNPDRIRMYNLAASDGPRFVKIAQEMTDHIRALGASPVNTGTGPEWPPKEAAGDPKEQPAKAASAKTAQPPA